MAWTLRREDAPASVVTLPVLRGDVTVTEEQADAIFVSLDGTRTVHGAPPQPPSPQIPRLHFGPKQQTDLARLRLMVQSRAVCLLTSDYGVTYRVRCTGSWAPVFVATTQRLTKPHWEVSLTFVGV